MPTNLEQRFHQAMIEVYKEAKSKLGYNATRFLQMVTEHGGVEAARRLINASEPSEGYGRLFELGRLDLTVEAYALRPEWAALFSPKELELARRRLREYGYDAAE